MSAEVIVVGIDVTPNTDLAVQAGLAADDGIVVDEHGRTSAPFVYAAGDVTRQPHPQGGLHVRMESWQNANEQALVASRSLAGQLTGSSGAPWEGSEQGGLIPQLAGTVAGTDRIVVRLGPHAADTATFFRLAEGRVIVGVTFNRCADIAALRRLIEKRELALEADLLTDPEMPLRGFVPSRR